MISQLREKVVLSILYDSFLFKNPQRNYSTYKRELCAIIEFCRRHRHYFTARETSIIFTDHKPLTWFINSIHQIY